MQRTTAKRTLNASAVRITVSGMLLLVCFAIISASTLMGYAIGDRVENVMEIGRHDIAVIEDFTPPDAQYPGDTVKKIVSFANTGDMASLIRVRYDELWKARSGDALSNHFALNGELYPAMVKNWEPGGLPNSAFWTDGGDGYYYYNFVLEPGAATKPVLGSVTVNKDLLASPEMVAYAKADWSLTFYVESVGAGLSDAAVKGLFGSHVSVSVSNSIVTWNFS